MMCPQCAGPGVPLGTLGSREHFRCRDCGFDFSRILNPTADDIFACEDCGALHNEDYCPVCEEFDYRPTNVVASDEQRV